MKLKITTLVPAVLPDPNTYVVEIESMRGDGEDYRTFTIGPFYRDNDEASLESALQTLERMTQRFPSGMLGGNSYSDVPGFLHWFGQLWDLDNFETNFPDQVKYGREYHETLLDLAESLRSDDVWPSDDYGNDDELVGYRVYYYTSDGEKFNVEFSL